MKPPGEHALAARLRPEVVLIHHHLVSDVSEVSDFPTPPLENNFTTFAQPLTFQQA
jgi:hypothetical protein